MTTDDKTQNQPTTQTGKPWVELALGRLGRE